MNDPAHTVASSMTISLWWSLRRCHEDLGRKSSTFGASRSRHAPDHGRVRFWPRSSTPRMWQPARPSMLSASSTAELFENVKIAKSSRASSLRSLSICLTSSSSGTLSGANRIRTGTPSTM